jgi:hypothetical protein
VVYKEGLKAKVNESSKDLKWNIHDQF